MIKTENIVSFEIAKLLKHKGFPQEYDEFSDFVYNEEEYEHEYEVQRMVLQSCTVKSGTISSYPAEVPKPKCYAPTYEEVLEWLRENHNIYIMVEPHSFAQNKAVDYEANYWFEGHYYEPYCTKNHPLEGKAWCKYKDATDAIIDYCITTLIN